VACEGTNDKFNTSRCCGDKGAACSSTDECCNGRICVEGRCIQTDAGGGTGSAVCGSTGHDLCAAIGVACSAAVHCCDGFVCRGGTCAKPKEYHLVGFYTDTYQQAYDYPFGSNEVPKAIAVGKYVYVILTSPPSLIAIDLPALKPQVVASLALPFEPLTVGIVEQEVALGTQNALQLYAPANQTFVAKELVALQGTPRGVAWSPNATKEVTIATSAPDALYQVAFQNLPGKQLLGSADLTLLGLGAPVGVTTNGNDVVAATRSPAKLAHFVTPKLTMTAQHNPPADPVGVDGLGQQNNFGFSEFAVALKASPNAKAKLVEYSIGFKQLVFDDVSGTPLRIRAGAMYDGCRSHFSAPPSTSILT
jgi:hypothetical protein